MGTPSPNPRPRSLLSDDEIEPYVRKQRPDGEPRRKLLALNEEEQNIMRTSINSRERKRMHDLNEALEELRSCLPYSQDSSSRKMSKINTLLLASNWIRQLTMRNHELQKQLIALRAGEQITAPASSVATFAVAPAPLAFGIGPAPCVKALGQHCFCISCLTNVKH
ncbi:Helix-loop-helix DNA-binding domain protein [Necator americanus]|uniref:Helix-loop-helix DNA-binding domain protein n=1 Tax=Necator americanus TaxID=51031 RepID=W2SZE3_NECAM|nr:Helix-loop-helix DNA-binding domain protein [Necator americanus]ETN75110.1 Helix-loop-helix DNA-binding domain protein [Necator americanus]